MEKHSLNILFNLSFCVTQKNLIWNTDLVRNKGDNIFITGMICFFNNFANITLAEVTI